MSKSIKKRFLGWILPVQLVTLLILGITAYLFGSRIVTRQAKESFTQTINVVFEQIENELGERMEKVRRFYRSPSLLKFVSAPYYKSSFDVDAFNFQRGNGLVLGEPEIGGLVNYSVGFLVGEGNKKIENIGTFPSIEFVNRDGFVIQHLYLGGSNDADFDIPNNPKLDRRNRTWFKEAVKGKTYVSRPGKELLYLREYDPVKISMEERVRQEELITIALPYKIGNEVVGVLMVTTRPDFLQIAAPEGGAEEGEKTLLMVVDSKGDTITKLGRTSSVEAISVEEIKGILVQDAGQILDNGTELLMYKRVPVADWAVIIAKDKRDIYASVFNLRNRMMLIIVGSIVFMAVLIVIVIRKLLMPIIRLRNASERIAGGELGLTVEKEGEDELAALTESFNTMSTRVKHMHTELEKSNIRLANVGFVRKQMLQMMSHELRTPITGIVGFYELLEEYIKSGKITEESSMDEVRELFGHMGESIKEFESLIQRMTKASYLVSAEVKKEGEEVFEPSDLGSVIRSVTMKIRDQLEERRIELRVDVPETCLVRCPSDMLQLLFDEALSNAVKYSKDESEIVIVGRTREDTVEIDIMDQGSGIPQKYMDEVVEPFFEVADALHHSTGRYRAQGGGLGLGMTIIINIVKKYGGVLEIKSKEGEGTTLHITLPKNSR